MDVDLLAPNQPFHVLMRGLICLYLLSDADVLPGTVPPGNQLPYVDYY